MDAKRFDDVTRTWAVTGSRRRVIGGLLAAAVAGVLPRRVAAQDLPDIASAGNGGVAGASANGGAVGIGNINSGGNAGNAIGVGDTVGAVGVDGGDVANVTDIGMSADGGTAIADASGGDGNTAFVPDEELAAADNEVCKESGDHCNDNGDCCDNLTCCRDEDDKLVCQHEDRCADRREAEDDDDDDDEPPVPIGGDCCCNRDCNRNTPGGPLCCNINGRLQCAAPQQPGQTCPGGGSGGTNCSGCN